MINFQTDINRSCDPIFALMWCGASRQSFNKDSEFPSWNFGSRLIKQHQPYQCHPLSSQVSHASRSEIRIHFWSPTSCILACQEAARACAHAPTFFVSLPHYLRRHSNLIHHAPRKNGRTEGEEREKKNEGRISKERTRTGYITLNLNTAARRGLWRRPFHIYLLVTRGYADISSAKIIIISKPWPDFFHLVTNNKHIP